MIREARILPGCLHGTKRSADLLAPIKGETIIIFRTEMRMSTEENLLIWLGINYASAGSLWRRNRDAGIVAK